MRTRLFAFALALPLALTLPAALPGEAQAFCGFYVSGADAKLFNNATLVVMMREGTRTVLSMQNNYQGPPADFALVVPVPVVLQKENVKTLPNEVFDRVDKLAAPRLVEYWEQDPCAPPYPERAFMQKGAVARAPMAAPGGGADLGVKIEAQFEVGEYDVVILSAKDALGLDTWLRQNKYKIPAGAEPVLRPYVQQGMKFFVAKVNTKKVRFEGNQAMLSPLRFHYDSDTFSLPVRLGLINSSGTQDLIVHILARGQRYEVANYPNVTIPTNIDIAEAAEGRFPALYAALFDKTVEKNKGAVVTEYSWDASSCDPCPTPALSGSDLMTLGADVLSGNGQGASPSPGPTPRPMRPGQRPPGFFSGGFVITRLHARYSKESLGDDLVFKAAPPIMGGREVRGADGKLEHGAQPSGMNNFQGRYAIRHEWKGPISCENPRRGIWGGPPDGAHKPVKAAQNLAFMPRGGVQLASMIASPVSELGINPAPAAPEAPAMAAPSAAPNTPPANTAAPVGPEPVPPAPSGCGACAVGSAPRGASTLPGLLLALGMWLFASSRRRR